MAGQVKEYALYDLHVVVNGRRLQNIPDDGEAKIAFQGEDASAKQDVNGNVMFSDKESVIAEVSVPVLNGYPDNAYLGSLLAGKTAISLSVIDQRGATRVSGRGRIKAHPELSYGADAGSVEWVFLLSIGTWTLGDANAL